MITDIKGEQAFLETSLSQSELNLGTDNDIQKALQFNDIGKSALFY